MTDLTPEREQEIRKRVNHPLARRLTDVYVADVLDLLAALDAERVRAETLGMEAAKREARLRELAVMFDVPDGGQYLNDWKERAARFERVADLEAVAEAARAYDQHFRLNLGCHTGCPEHEELRDALARLDANKDTTSAPLAPSGEGNRGNPAPRVEIPRKTEHSLSTPADVKQAIQDEIAADDFGGSSFLCDCDQADTGHAATCRARCYAELYGDAG